MGSYVSTIITSLFICKDDDRKMKILILGLDGAGKTTMLYKMKLSEYIIHTVPTIGFNVEELDFKNLKMVIWDIGGQGSIRKLWNYYYEGSQALIFVVDSSDVKRIDTAKEEIHSMMSDPSLSGAKLLVFANKMDIAKVSVKDLCDRLELNKLTADWYIQGAVATTGEGLYNGFEWLSNTIDKTRQRL